MIGVRKNIFLFNTTIRIVVLNELQTRTLYHASYDNNHFSRGVHDWRELFIPYTSFFGNICHFFKFKFENNENATFQPTCFVTNRTVNNPNVRTESAGPAEGTCNTCVFGTSIGAAMFKILLEKNDIFSKKHRAAKCLPSLRQRYR